MQQQPSHWTRKSRVKRRKKRLSRSPRLSPSSGIWCAPERACVGCRGNTGGSSAARLSRKRGPSQGGEHAQGKPSAAPSAEARGGLRSTRELPSFPEMAAEGEPGAHVLAVVPAHRDTYAEVRGRCRLQISSRNALQKQRSDESEREPRWVAVPGFSRGSVHRRSIATPSRGGQRPRRRRKAQGGVTSATRRHGLSREDRVACLARCGFGRPRMPETSASEGSSRMEVALGC